MYFTHGQMTKKHKTKQNKKLILIIRKMLCIVPNDQLTHSIEYIHTHMFLLTTVQWM